MGTWNAFYVRNSGDSTASAIRRKFPAAKFESGQEFVGVVLTNDAFEPPADKLAELSSDLATDVIWLSFQSVVDAFEFHHWRGGTAVRSLVFGCYRDERTWERVEGEAEPWERSVFFDPKTLRYPLEYAATDEEKREFERIWREAELLPGRTEPSLDSCESAHKVAEYYHFPGWS
jgi:FAD/FMN-containing dehydrogenase